MKNCVFCKIVRGEIPSEKIAEDEKFVAFLSIRPVVPGMTIIATKKHYGSYVYKTLPDEMLFKIHKFAKDLALKLDEALGTERCAQIMEGFEVDHAHIKLFPKPKGSPSDFLGWPEKEASFEELKKVGERVRKIEVRK